MKHLITQRTLKKITETTIATPIHQAQRARAKNQMTKVVRTAAATAVAVSPKMMVLNDHQNITLFQHGLVENLNTAKIELLI